MTLDFIKEGALIPKWITALDSYIKNIEEKARAEGYEAGFDDGRGLTAETKQIVNFALKLPIFNDLNYMDHLLEAVKCYSDALDEIIDPTVTEVQT